MDGDREAVRDTPGGLGDLNSTFFLSPAKPGALIWGEGPTFTLPTATDSLLGTGKWSMGPAAVALTMQGPRTLQNEKSHVAQQIAMGVTAIAPAGIVMGVLTGTEQTKLQMATGNYNRMIDQRIADINMTYGLP